MTRIRRGRGGWETRIAGVARLAALALVCVALGATGCSSKKATPDNLANPGGGGGSNLGEQGTGGSGSLENLQKGTVGTEGPLHDIHFAYNDYTVQEQDGPVLRDNASWLNSHATAHVQVEGHCDERGSEDYNIALGAKRAQAAKDYLITLGIPGSRVSTISYGKELPVCTEHNETCWAQNRRDHFVVSGNQ